MERRAETERATPSPEEVLGWIASSAAEPWFPSRHAAATGLPRDRLDAPLHELRTAELVRVADWVRGLGQGYVLTESGEAALHGKPTTPPAVPETALPDANEKPVIVRPLIVTPVLVYLNLIWYFVGLVVATRLSVSLRTYLLHGERTTLLRIWAVSPVELMAGEWWRLAASCFVHGTIWHLLVNAFNLAMIGALTEHLWGRWRTLAIYGIAGFAGSCLAMALRPLDPSGRVPVVLVGASGAIWGLATAIVAWLVLFHRRLERDVAVDLARRLGFGFLLSIGVSLLPGVSWEAHLGGALGGFAAAMLLHLVHVKRGWRRVLAIILVAMLPALSLGGLLAAIREAPAWAPFRVVPPAPPRPDPKPFLHALRPEAVRPAVRAAEILLMTNPMKWQPERVKAVREEIAALWSNAVEAAKRLEEPLADPTADAIRARERVFAETRRDSLSRLLAFLDARTLPTVAEWRDWGASNVAANRLWGEMMQPR